jgi:hypothetical protein
MRQFIDILNVEVIDVNADVARKYAAIFLSLQKKMNVLFSIPYSNFPHVITDIAASPGFSF